MAPVPAWLSGLSAAASGLVLAAIAGLMLPTPGPALAEPLHFQVRVVTTTPAATPAPSPPATKPAPTPTVASKPATAPGPAPRGPAATSTPTPLPPSPTPTPSPSPSSWWDNRLPNGAGVSETYKQALGRGGPTPAPGQVSATGAGPATPAQPPLAGPGHPPAPGPGPSISSEPTPSDPTAAPSAEQEQDERAERRRQALALGAARLAPAPELSGFWREVRFREQARRSADAARADPAIVLALLDLDGPGAGLGTAEAPLRPRWIRDGDDPRDEATVLLRAAEQVRALHDRWHLPELVAAAYFGALDDSGAVTPESGGALSGPEYVQRFRGAYKRYADGQSMLPGWLVSPFGDLPVSSRMIKFGYYGDYGEELAFEIRGESGVARYSTIHLGLDLQIPSRPNGGRGSPIVAPFDGRITRTSDPAGGPFGVLVDNRKLNLRARLMHMDGLVSGIESGVEVRAGQQLGILGAQGTEGFPHLHLAFERLSDGERINPALLYRVRDFTDPNTNPVAGRWPGDLETAWRILPSRAYQARLLPDADVRQRFAPTITLALPLALPVP